MRFPLWFDWLKSMLFLFSIYWPKRQMLFVFSLIRSTKKGPSPSWHPGELLMAGIESR